MNATRNNTFIISTGSDHSDVDEASAPIDDVIDMLREAKRMGAEYVTLENGDYYGRAFLTIYNEGEMADVSEKGD